MTDQHEYEQRSGSTTPGVQPTRPVFHSPDAPGASTAPVGAPGATAPSNNLFGAPYQAPYQAAYTSTYPPTHPSTGPYPAPGDGSGSGFPPGTGPAPRQGRRGPGWGGVLAVGAGAAVLSSLLTAGIVDRTTDSGTTGNARPAAASSAQSAPPLVTSSGKLPDWVSVAAAVEPSVVAVKVEAAQGGGEGSGIILDTSGRVLTNNHVVAEGGGGGRISVVLSDGRAYPGSIVGTDPSTDLAVIKIDNAVAGLKPATFGDSGAVRIGDPVMAAGNPLGLADTVTTGIISAVNRPVSTQGQGGGGQGGNPFGGQTRTEAVVTNAIQTDAAINPGNSGGALVDAGGRVVGITSSIASLSSGSGQSGSIGLGFAIPINEAKQVADQLVKTGKVQHAYLGVGLQDSSVAVDGAQREAAVLGSVNPGTPSAQAGLKARDAVIAINGQRIDSSDSLVGSIRALTPGTKVTLTIVRDGKKLDVDVTLGVRPASAG
jgi:putative serine protease PepD